jgi:hypothetical protein
MGESKRRKASDPNYGKPKPTPGLGLQPWQLDPWLPPRSAHDERSLFPEQVPPGRSEYLPEFLEPTQRGLVVSSPLVIQGGHIFVGSSNLDPQELRFSLLFWDRLAWPASRNIHFGSGPDEQFLETEGVLVRPFFTFDGLDAAGMAMTHIAAFKHFDQNEPGKWALAQGENSLLLRNGDLEVDKGAFIELYRAIPVPNRDVPLNDILEFKQKRHDELLLLRNEIDNIFSELNSANNGAAELANHVARIDAACADAIKVSKEWQFPVTLLSLKASFELRPFVTLVGAIAGYKAAGDMSLPMTTSILTSLGGAAIATAPALKIAPDFGWRGLRPRQGPYRYVSQFHHELF